jgi:hypothetical protein
MCGLELELPEQYGTVLIKQEAFYLSNLVPGLNLRLNYS